MTWREIFHFGINIFFIFCGCICQAQSLEGLGEKAFYLGVKSYKSKKNAQALNYFSLARKAKDKNIASKASFYAGVLLLEMQKWMEAKNAFQQVLDQSNDPKIDKRAEELIEKILRVKAFKEKKVQRNFYQASLGLIYDSNIILATQEAINTNQVQNQSGWRLLIQQTYKHRPYYTRSDELAVSLSATTVQSSNDEFQYSKEAKQADPYIFSLGLPWTHRTQFYEKPLFFDLGAYYELTLMDVTPKPQISIQTFRLDWNNTLVLNKKWILKGDLSLGFNDSSILGDEQVADSWTLINRFSSLFILDSLTQKFLVTELSYMINKAKSPDYAYNRWDLALYYSAPLYKKWMWNARLSYFLFYFENHRMDRNATLSLGLSHPMGSGWNWLFNGVYSLNSSNTNPYDKYTITSLFSYSY